MIGLTPKKQVTFQDYVHGGSLKRSLGAIYTATTIWTDCEAVCIKGRWLRLKGSVNFCRYTYNVRRTVDFCILFMALVSGHVI